MCPGRRLYRPAALGAQMSFRTNPDRILDNIDRARNRDAESARFNLDRQALGRELETEIPDLDATNPERVKRIFRVVERAYMRAAQRSELGKLAARFQAVGDIHHHHARGDVSISIQYLDHDRPDDLGMSPFEIRPSAVADAKKETKTSRADVNALKVLRKELRTGVLSAYQKVEPRIRDSLRERADMGPRSGAGDGRPASGGVIARAFGWAQAAGRASVLSAVFVSALGGQATTGTGALVGGTLVDGTGASPVADAVVVFRDGRITCAGAADECSVPEGVPTIDASGQWVVPGLIDGHMHYSQTGWADGRPDQATDWRERFPYEAAVAQNRANPERYFRSYLCSGVTATWDVGGYPWTWDLRARAENDPHAPHVSAAGPLLSARDHWLNVAAERQFLFMSDAESVEAAATYLVRSGTDQVKVWYLVGEDAPDAAHYQEMLRIGARVARVADTPLIVHATGLWQAKDALRAGASHLVHSVNDTDVDDEFVELALAAGASYNPTLTVTEGIQQFAARRFEGGHLDLGCVDPGTMEKGPHIRGTQRTTGAGRGTPRTRGPRPLRVDAPEPEARARRGYPGSNGHGRRKHAHASRPECLPGDGGDAGGGADPDGRAGRVHTEPGSRNGAGSRPRHHRSRENRRPGADLGRSDARHLEPPVASHGRARRMVVHGGRAQVPGGVGRCPAARPVAACWWSPCCSHF